MKVSQRRFLFLQSCTSPFFTRLADKLTQLNHQVFKVNFNLGDRLYWGGRPAWDFHEPAECLPEFYESIFKRFAFTDVIMLGDTRPVHTAVKPVAKRYQTELRVFEEGYFRPNWLTFETGGINGYSRLPKDPDWYCTQGKKLPDIGDGTSVANPLWLLAAHELVYHIPNSLNSIFFSGYKTHRPATSDKEFMGWAKRYAQLPFLKPKDKDAVRELIDENLPYYLLPLQLDSDAQIKVHSPFDSIEQVLVKVINSFARKAPNDSKLVIKIHPLDTGFVNLESVSKQLANSLGIADRIVFLNSGHLPTLLHNAKGVVTVNSTVGTSSLFHRCPTIALGDCIYNIKGLTYQGNLDEFWRDGVKPDKSLFRAVRKTVIHTTQINGGFYTESGIKLAVNQAANRLSLDVDPLTELL